MGLGATVASSWWAREDSNLQPDRYERSALTVELRARPKSAAGAAICYAAPACATGGLGAASSRLRAGTSRIVRRCIGGTCPGGADMLKYAIIFLIISLLA